MTRLDKLIEQIETDSQAKETMSDLLDELVDARNSMDDPSDEKKADSLASEILKKYVEGAISSNADDEIEVDAEYMEKTSTGVEEAFESQGWKNYGKRNRRNDLLQYELGFNVNNTVLRIIVLVEDAPKRIRFHAILPITGEKTYEYLLDKAIVDENKKFIYGAFQYDQNDGELTYQYSYPITHGFYRDDFLSIMRAVIRTAIDDDAYSAIKKAAQGRYKRKEREEILRQLEPLVEDLTDD